MKFPGEDEIGKGPERVFVKGTKASGVKIAYVHHNPH